VGQDAADELLEAGDAEGARQIIEKYVLSLVTEFKLLEHLVPVRAQRAVIMAYCGQHQEALAEIRRLKAFAVDDALGRGKQNGFFRTLDEDASGLSAKSPFPALDRG
jgi:hypothetical protein